MPPPGEVASIDDTAALSGDGVIETFVRFGPAGRLAGVLCEPQGEPQGRRAGASALLLNAGGDPHTGWARSGVDQARTLARRGAASFRIDLTGFGDSASPLSAEPPRLCDPQHVADALAAVAWLEGRGLGPVLVVGRCSGASVALAAALRDARIRDLVLINPRRFSADFEDFGETAGERLAHYRDRLSAPAAVLRRGLRGELDFAAAICSLGGAAARRAWAAASGHERRRRRRVVERFEACAARGLRTTLLYSETGPAWSAFEQAFGPGGGRLRRLAGLEIRRIAGADRNLTPAAARAALVELLCERALTPPPPAASAPDRAPEKCNPLALPLLGEVSPPGCGLRPARGQAPATKGGALNLQVGVFVHPSQGKDPGIESP
jgi:dienelactone hydrolase